MKKITLIAVAFIAVSFASCSKAKTCTCTTTQTYNGISYGNTTTSTTSMEAISSGDANVICPKSETNTTANSSGSDVSTKTCVLS